MVVTQVTLEFDGAGKYTLRWWAKVNGKWESYTTTVPRSDAINILTDTMPQLKAVDYIEQWMEANGEAQ